MTDIHLFASQKQINKELADAIAAAGGLSDGNKGDITVSGSGATWTINNDSISNDKLEIVATSTIKGRVTAGTGDVEDLTGTQATTLLNVFTSGLKGLVPASGGGTTNFLRADGTFAAPPSGSGANTGQEEVDFGAVSQETDIAVVTVAAPWVTSASIITCSPAATATATHDPDDYFAEGIQSYISNIVNGVSFDIVATSKNMTFGTYNINYSGV